MDKVRTRWATAAPVGTAGPKEEGWTNGRRFDLLVGAGPTVKGVPVDEGGTNIEDAGPSRLWAGRSQCLQGSERETYPSLSQERDWIERGL